MQDIAIMTSLADLLVLTPDIAKQCEELMQNLVVKQLNTPLLVDCSSFYKRVWSSKVLWIPFFLPVRC